MKKKVFGILFAAILAISFFIPNNNVQAEEPDDWYKVTWHFEYINGTWYYVTECTDTLGDECNMPGSIHRTKIWED